MFRFEDSEAAYWYLPGGGIEPGEDPVSAACRELREETGLVIEAVRVIAERRNLAFVFHGEPITQDEWIVLARSNGPVGQPASSGDAETSNVAAHRWWSMAEVRETRDTIFPPRLADLLALAHDGAQHRAIIRLE